MSEYFFPTAFLIFEMVTIAFTRLSIALVDWKYRDYEADEFEEVLV